MKHSQVHVEDEVQFVNLISMLLTRKIWFLGSIIAAVLLGILYNFSIPRVYQVSISTKIDPTIPVNAQNYVVNKVKFISESDWQIIDDKFILQTNNPSEIEFYEKDILESARTALELLRAEKINENQVLLEIKRTQMTEKIIDPLIQNTNLITKLQANPMPILIAEAKISKTSPQLKPILLASSLIGICMGVILCLILETNKRIRD